MGSRQAAWRAVQARLRLLRRGAQTFLVDEVALARSKESGLLEEDSERRAAAAADSIDS